MHQKIKFIPMKIHKTVTTRAAPFGPVSQICTKSFVGWGFASLDRFLAVNAPEN